MDTPLLHHAILVQVFDINDILVGICQMIIVAIVCDTVECAE